MGQCILLVLQVKFFTYVDGVLYFTCVVIPFGTLATCVYGSVTFTYVASEVFLLMLTVLLVLLCQS